MTKIVSLNQARKDKARLEAKAQAVENRVRFGRTKLEKAAAQAAADKAGRALDGAKRED